MWVCIGDTSKRQAKLRCMPCSSVATKTMRSPHEASIERMPGASRTARSAASGVAGEP
jgi:hypothetical protein